MTLRPREIRMFCFSRYENYPSFRDALFLLSDVRETCTGPFTPFLIDWLQLDRDNKKLRIYREQLSEEGKAMRVKKIQIGRFL